MQAVRSVDNSEPPVEQDLTGAMPEGSTSVSQLMDAQGKRGLTGARAQPDSATARSTTTKQTALNAKAGTEISSSSQDQGMTAALKHSAAARELEDDVFGAEDADKEVKRRQVMRSPRKHGKSAGSPLAKSNSSSSSSSAKEPGSAAKRKLVTATSAVRSSPRRRTPSRKKAEQLLRSAGSLSSHKRRSAAVESSSDSSDSGSDDSDDLTIGEALEGKFAAAGRNSGK